MEAHIREVLGHIERLAREACVADSRDPRDWRDDMNYIAVVARSAIETAGSPSEVSRP